MEWNNIPISEEINTLKLPIEGSPTATGMGNPHCTFFVDDVDQIDLENLGPKFENHPLFPEKTNVQFAKCLGSKPSKSKSLGARSRYYTFFRLIFMCGSSSSRKK